VLWAARGPLGRRGDVLDIWAAWADDVRGAAIDSGHHLPEEAPEATLRALQPFLA
jgi:haloacetate dehalogenase